MGVYDTSLVNHPVVPLIRTCSRFTVRPCMQSSTFDDVIRMGSAKHYFTIAQNGMWIRLECTTFNRFIAHTLHYTHVLKGQF